MPNFKQVQQLRKAYSSNIQIQNRLNEGYIDVIEKSFSRSDKFILENFHQNRLPSDIIEYLEREEEAHVVNIFVDITSFSTKASLMTNNQLSNYLDRYYSIVIPIIHKNGGEIEKIIGDGIIALFGQPFLADNTKTLIDKADKCSKEIITALENSEWAVKVALHDGIIQYYKNKNIDGEYTMIGQPLTDLFRLESVSENNAINYYCSSNYDESHSEDIITYNENDKKTYWVRSKKERIKLKGVNFEFKRNFEKVDNKEVFHIHYNLNQALDRVKNNLDINISNEKINKNRFKIPNEKGIVKSERQIYVSVLYVKVDLEQSISSANKLIIYKTVFEEILSIALSVNSYYQHFFINDELFVIFNTPSKFDVTTIFRISAQIITIKNVINTFLAKKNIPNFNLKIALDNKQTFINDINNESVWQGNIFTSVRNLTNDSQNVINASHRFVKECLFKKQQEFFIHSTNKYVAKVNYNEIINFFNLNGIKK